MTFIPKPINTWTTDGMYSAWREKTPLRNIERYLWKKFRRYPRINGFDKAAWKGRSPLHVWYQDGWSFINSLETNLFCASSVCGREDNPPFLGHQCEWEGCGEPASCLRNKEECGKNSEGEKIYRWLPDAPQFHCFEHHMKVHYGEDYKPPTEDENRRLRAMSRAIERISEERPAEKRELLGGLCVHSTVMDAPYLKRLAEISEEEYNKLMVGNRPH